MTLGCTLNELGDRMSLQEFKLWQLLDAESPLPDVRGDIQAAMIAQSVVNMAGKAVKKTVSLKDCLPPFDVYREESKPVDVVDTLRNLKNAKARD